MIFVAEVASTFNEELLSRPLLQRAQDDRRRAILINRQIDAMRGTIFRQAMFAEFEKITHELAESGEPLTVGGLRTIRRGIALAGRWGLPVVTVVDTLGAQLSVQGEESGIAGEISRLMTDLVSTPSPSVALLLGAGTGGAALALLASDRIVAGSHTWVSPLAPEGAAAIRHGGTHDPARIAWEQRIGAHALAELGFIDVIVRESEPGWLATAVDQVVAQVGSVLAGADPGRRVARFASWDAIGVSGG